MGRERCSSRSLKVTVAVPKMLLYRSGQYSEVAIPLQEYLLQH